MALRCDKAQSWLSQALDARELAPGRRQKLEAHVAGCADCQAFRAAQETVAASLRQHVERELAEVDLAPLWGRIEAALDAEPKRPLSWRERVQLWLSELSPAYRALVLGGAAAVLVLAAGVAPAWVATARVDHGVAIESIETADTDDGTSTAILSVPDGKGGTTTVIWVTEPEVSDDLNDG